MSGLSIESVLVEHEYALNLKSNAICRCGFVPAVTRGALSTQQDYHRAHLAAAVERIVAAREAEVLERLSGDEVVEAAARAYWLAAGWDWDEDVEASDKPNLLATQALVLAAIRAALADPARQLAADPKEQARE